MRIFEVYTQNKLNKSWLKQASNGLLPFNNDNLSKAKEFVFQKWKERAIERGRNEPIDLAYSCKFGTLFMKLIFGGKIEGNFDHQYNVINGKIIDLSNDAEDVLKLIDPYHHDDKFFGSRDHIDSMNSCMQRVNTWVKEFLINNK